MFVCKAHLSGGQTEFSLALDALMLHNAQCTCKISQSIRRPHATSVIVWERSLANTSTAAANDFSRILSSPSYLLHGVVSCFCITLALRGDTNKSTRTLFAVCVFVCFCGVHFYTDILMQMFRPTFTASAKSHERIRDPSISGQQDSQLLVAGCNLFAVRCIYYFSLSSSPAAPLPLGRLISSRQIGKFGLAQLKQV